MSELSASSYRSPQIDPANVSGADLEFIHAAAWVGQNLIANNPEGKVDMKKLYQTLAHIQNRLNHISGAHAVAHDAQPLAMCCSRCGELTGMALVICIETCDEC